MCPTANSQQPTANSQQPTANSQQPRCSYRSYNLILFGKLLSSKLLSFKKLLFRKSLPLKLFCVLAYSSFGIANPSDFISSFFDRFNKKGSDCENCFSFHDAEENNLCPDFFIKQILEEDYSAGFLLKAPSKQCSSAQEQNQHILSSRGESFGFKHPEDLENFLREHEEFSGFQASPLLSNCLSKPVVLSEEDRGQSHQINLPKTLPEDQHFLATGEYYFTLKRLQEALRNDIEDLAGIDKLIGEEESALLEDVSCRGLQFTKEALSECDEIKKCSSQRGGMLQVSQNTLVAMQGLDRIEKRIEELSPNINKVMKNKEEIDELKQRKQVLQALYPWMAGAEFRSGYDPEKIKTKEQMAELIKRQLRKSREKLKEQFEERKGALNCVSGMKGRNCSSAKVARTISKTPALSVTDIFRKKSLPEEDDLKRQTFSREQLVQNYFFSEAECRQSNRGLIAEQKEEVVLGLLDTAGVLGTVGIGSAWIAARIASRVGSYANRARTFQATALLTADTIFSAPYIKEAYDICSEGFDRLEREETEALSSENVCRRFPVRTKLSRDYTSCLLSASLASLPITMPLVGLVGGSVRRANNILHGPPTTYVNNIHSFEYTRVSRARNILGRNLTREEDWAVHEAHLVGAGKKGKDGTPARIGNYTQAQLAKKNRILKEAGFTPAEIRKLMEDGVVGVDKPIE